MQFASKIVEGYDKTFFPAETAPKDGTLIAGLIVLEGDFVTIAPSLYWDPKNNGWFADHNFGPFELRKWNHLAWYTVWLFDELAKLAGPRH